MKLAPCSKYSFLIDQEQSAKEKVEAAQLRDLADHFFGFQPIRSGLKFGYSNVTLYVQLLVSPFSVGLSALFARLVGQRVVAWSVG